jgi:hypothetical protein
MGVVFAVNENNDIYATPGGILATAEGLDGLVFSVGHATKAKKGEMLYAVDKGVDYDNTVFTGSVDLVKLEASLRNAINAVPEVNGTNLFEVSVDGDVVSYVATVDTIYGEEEISGVVNG